MAPRNPYQMMLAPMPLARTEPDRSALVILDTQIGMTRPEHGLGREAAARGITAELREYYRQAEAAVPNLATLAQAFRAAGGFVVHSLLAHGPRLSRQLRLSRLPLPSEVDAAASIERSLGPEPGDVVLTRGTYGAFASGELGAVLADRRIDQIFLGGMLANVSVALSAREAADRDYRVVVVQDAAACECFEWHSLTMLGLAGGAIRTAWTEEALEMLEGSRT